MTTRLTACYFMAKREPDGQYDRLARVLAYTAAQHCPGWEVDIRRITPEIPAPCTGNPSHAWNTSKLAWWADAVERAEEGTQLVLMDADMMILRPLQPLWDRPFDLAYTIRDPQTSRLPLNGGFVALRVSDRTKAAVRQWQIVDDRMCRLGTDHATWHRKYAGMNQSSFGSLLEQDGFAGLTVVELPCQEWNCCEWTNFSPTTRVVHVKSRLRRVVFGSAPGPESLLPLAATWHALEAEAVPREVRA